MVTGETTLNDLRVNNNTVLKNLTATGVTNVNTLNVSGASVFNAGATFSKGVTINENLTVGAGTVVNMGGNKITNVPVGTADNDAATVGQINTVVDGLASTPMGFAGNTGVLNRKIGETLKITGSNSVAGTYSGANIRTRAEGDTVHIEMADAPVFTGGLTVNGASNLTGGATIGSSLTLAADTTVSMGMNVVSGVASGVKDNDAVNLSQLKEVKNIADNAAAEAGKGWNLSDGVTTTKVAPGATATISNTDNNIDVKLTGTNMSINLAQDIAINSITVQNGGPVINNTGINMHEQRITNLGDAVTLSDAVNLKQLNEVKNTLVDAGWNLQVNGDTPSKVKNGDTVAINSGKNIQVTRTENGVSIATEDDVSYNSVTAQTQVKVGSTTVNSSGVYVGGSSGPSMTSEGVDAGHSVVSNVADGRAPSDAVNVSQLHRATEGISSNINKLASDMSRIEKNANAGSATAGAIASLPQAGNAGETMFAIAHAGYRGESAYAAGLSAVSDNGKWVLKGNLAGNSRGGVMYGVGAGYRW